ncbi:MAG: hypothetical protein INR62_11335, partial [Rhodospirillales bacterium]|nr:hypothetical protein [Acetobacter sp.]
MTHLLAVPALACRSAAIRESDIVTVSDTPSLGFGFEFHELAAREGLIRLDRCFLDDLTASDPALAQRLLGARANPAGVSVRDEGELVVALGPHLDRFVATLFG